jgi:ion channel-forming bestrophin family protein
MITYNPKDWWKLIFAFHRSDTFRILLPGMVGVAIFTAFVAYLENEVWITTFKNTTVVHSLMGLVLSLLLVFRTNTAYDRWWEGRRVWGSIVNNSRNLALKLNAFLPEEATETKRLFRILICNYVVASKEHLRHGVKQEHLEVTGIYGLDYYTKAKHIPNQVAKAIYVEIDRLFRNKNLTGDQLIILNAELQSFTDNLGACERIRKTPIPYAYSLFLKKVIFLYVFTMPIGFAVEFKYWSIVIVTLVFYVFASIEVIAEEIENPFGTDANDLPIDDITMNIKGNLLEILGK